MMPMFLTVFLSNNDQHFTEVPVTPETLSRDVVELCKEPGENECHLAEMWRGAERVVGDGERMMEVLQHWGQQRGEVRFILRHERAPGRDPGGCREQAKRTLLKASLDRTMENRTMENRTMENGVCGPRVDVTLSDLQDMAARQQLQINAQQQLLASKEQRLRYLKQQEHRVEQRAQQQQASEQERLRQLRENAHNQEAKLRRVRALRGQVEQKRASNSKLVEEIEQITGLFQQKQRDLLLAVSRVEELSQQLESLRSSRMEPPHLTSSSSSSSSSSAVELERLYKELQLRNKLNQEQSGRLQQQRETLNKRNLEVDTMDRRVAELRQRLWKKKAALQQKENLPTVPDGQGPGQQQCVSSRVAAVGPYIQSSSNGPQGPPVPARHEVLVKPAYPDGTATLPMPESSGKPPPRPLKPASGFQTSKARPSDWSSSSLDSGGGYGHASTLPRMTSLSCQNTEAEKDVPPPIPARTNHNTDNHLRDNQVSGGKGPAKPPKAAVPPPIPSKPKQFSSSQQAFGMKPPYSTGTFPGKANKLPAGGLGGGSHLRAPPPLPTHSHTLPLPPKQDNNNPPAATVRPFTPDPVEASPPQQQQQPPPPVLQKPQMVAASSIYSMYTQQMTPGKIYAQPGQSTLTRSQARVYGKPVLPPTGGQQAVSSDGSTVSVGSSVTDGGEAELSCLLLAPPGPPGGGGEGGLLLQGPPEPSSERAAPRPLSPTKLLPFVSNNPHRNPTDADLEALRRRLHHAPRPLKKRSSITEPEGPAGPNIQKLLYQKTTLAAMETIPADAVAMTTTAAASPYQVYYDDTPEDDRMGSSEHSRGTAPGSGHNPTDMHHNQSGLAPPPLPPRSPIPDSGHCLPPPLEEELGEACPPSSPPVQEPYMEEYPPYPPPPYPSAGDQDPGGEDALSMKPPEVTGQVTLPPGKRTNLRKAGSERIDHGMRVKFNPLALLLDSSLEGEYDLVQRVIYDVADPSMPNDEGITALHNAVCAGHTEIVKFLVQFGVNVNAADSDGWTPLHCAASCNNVQVCKFLVESGAAVFATTYSDMQTAADKCEEMEDGYAQCSQFLYGVQEKMGVMNRGVVYALWDYEADGEDELGFLEGDCMTVLRREDQLETDWWWARCGDREGYIPRNLLGLYLRIRPRQRSLA